MEWLRKWFRRDTRCPRPTRAHIPLQVESLEERTVPSATSFVDNFGLRTSFIVDSNHNLIQISQTGQQTTLGGGALSVHAFRDARGALGLDLVLTNNDYYTIDSNGIRFVAHGVLSASETFATSLNGNRGNNDSDNNGNGTFASGFPTLDIVFTNHTAYRISTAGITTIGTNIQEVSNYVDFRGFVGLDFVTTDNNAFEIDSFGARNFGPGIESLNHFNALTTFNQEEQNGTNGQANSFRTVYDLVFATSNAYYQIDSIGGGRFVENGVL